MSIQEWIEGSGIYKVGLNMIGPYTWFLRQHSVDGEFHPLLHICERDKDLSGSVWVCMTGVVRWDMQGYYVCRECKQTFCTQDDLEAVWEDGKGTGDEGEA